MLINFLCFKVGTISDDPSHPAQLNILSLVVLLFGSKLHLSVLYLLISIWPFVPAVALLPCKCVHSKSNYEVFESYTSSNKA
jgi:hypothetical protein